MSSESKSKNSGKNLKALFSVICLSIIALGVIVYYSTNKVDNKGTVNEPTTVVETTTNAGATAEQTTAVQKSVTVEDTTVKETEAQTVPPTTEAEATTMKLTDTNTPFKSFYKYPLDEAVVNGYSEELVINETMGDYRSHTAVDFKGEQGREVAAINDGIVMEVYIDELYGTTVVIDHGGTLIAKYCGLDVVNVAEGEAVLIGDAIGTLGVVPFESKLEPHLHFETRLDGNPVNPLDVMGKTE